MSDDDLLHLKFNNFIGTKQGYFVGLIEGSNGIVLPVVIWQWDWVNIALSGQGLTEYLRKKTYAAAVQLRMLSGERKLLTT